MLDQGLCEQNISPYKMIMLVLNHNFLLTLSQGNKLARKRLDLYWYLHRKLLSAFAMKQIILASLFLIFTSAIGAQNISRINLAGGDVTFVLGLDDHVSFYLTKDGTVSKWGYDKYAAAGADNYMEAVENYQGRVEYYNDQDDIAYRGKVKYIGRYKVTWYASYEMEAMRGKLKSIGNIIFDYYQAYENEAFRGNIKSFGQKAVSWYSSFDNATLKGKIKSFGPSAITWYSSLDDIFLRGKVKSIGNTSYTWYSSFDLPQYRGSLKTGNPVQFVDGVKYIVRN